MVPKLRFKRDDGTDYHEWKEKSLKKLLKPNDKIPVDTAKYRKITIGLHLRGVSFYETKREMADKRPFYLRKEGEIIIGKQNYFNGSVALITRKFNNTICSNAIMSFMPSSNDVIAQFLLLAISNNNFLKKREYIATGTGQQELSEKAFLNFKVLIPCLEEQSKIADFLSTVDEVIKESEAELKNLELQKKAAMQKIFSQEVRFKRDDGRKYPKWESKRIGELTSQLTERNKDNANYPVYSVNNIKGFIPQSEQFEDREVASNNKANYKIVEYHHFAYNPSRINVGSIAYLREHKAVIVSPLYVVFKCTGVMPEYLDLYVITSNFHNQRKANTSGSVRDSLSYDGFSEITIPFPCLEEQQKIADFFSVYDKAINYAKQELEHWKQLKKGLLQQMFV